VTTAARERFLAEKGRHSMPRKVKKRKQDPRGWGGEKNDGDLPGACQPGRKGNHKEIKVNKKEGTASAVERFPGAGGHLTRTNKQFRKKGERKKEKISPNARKFQEKGK